MPRKRKKPYNYGRFPVSKTQDDLIVDTTEKERLRVFQMCEAIGKYFIKILVVTGALSFFLFSLCLLGTRPFSTHQLRILSIIALGFIGVVNLISGLLLLAVE